MPKKPDITLTEEQFEKLKEESKQPYLSEKRFTEFLQNDFHALCNKVSRIDGIQWLLVVLVMVILGVVLKLAFGD